MVPVYQFRALGRGFSCASNRDIGYGLRRIMLSIKPLDCPSRERQNQNPDRCRCDENSRRRPTRREVKQPDQGTSRRRGRLRSLPP